MSAINVDSLKIATNQSNIYGGFYVFCIGMIGNIFNIIIFTSLKTFRETPAAFYLNITSIVDIFQLIVGLLSRILMTGYNIDPTTTSLFICKTRQFTLITTMLIAFTCMCFAAIDQYLSLTNRWRHLCNIKIASRLVMISIVLWCLHGIPLVLLNDIYPIPFTNQTACSSSNQVFTLYTSRSVFPVLLGFLPLIIRISFGLLAFLNVRYLHNREIPIVRLEQDKQLTKMVLVEVVVDLILTLPYSIYNHFYSNSVIFSDRISNAQNELIIAITRIVFYGNFAISFYIYFCVSSRFRRQLMFVLVDIHFNYWREKINHRKENRIIPQEIINGNDLSGTNCITNKKNRL